VKRRKCKKILLLLASSDEVKSGCDQKLFLQINKNIIAKKKKKKKKKKEKGKEIRVVRRV